MSTNKGGAIGVEQHIYMYVRLVVCSCSIRSALQSATMQWPFGANRSNRSYHFRTSRVEKDKCTAENENDELERGQWGDCDKDSLWDADLMKQEVDPRIGRCAARSVSELSLPISNHHFTKSKLENVAIANALQFATWGRRTSRLWFWTVLANFVLRMRTNCYSTAFDQNSDIAIRYSDRDFIEREQ